MLILFLSCSENNKQINEITFENIQMKNNSVDMVCDSLKENINFLNNTINDFSILSDSLFVITNGKNVYIYDFNGKQIKSIGAYGKGPSEYISANQLFISNDYIYIWCSTLLKLILYDKNGNYVKEYKEFGFAIQKFVVLNEKYIYFYISGNSENDKNIKIYDILQNKFINEFGTITEEDKLLFLNNNNGAICTNNTDAVFYSAPSSMIISSIYENKDNSSAYKIADPNFKNTKIENASEMVNNNFVEAIKYLTGNSTVSGLHFHDNIYLMIENGEIILDETTQTVDYSNRRIKIFTLDNSFNPINVSEYPYFEYALKFKFYKNWLYFISNNVINNHSNGYSLKKLLLN